MKPNRTSENFHKPIQFAGGLFNLFNTEKTNILVTSQFNNNFIYSRIKIGLVLILILFIFTYKLGVNVLTLSSLGGVLFVFIVYLNFTLNHLYIWEFGEDIFTKKQIIRRTKSTYHYTEISTYQERMRFGTVSRNETIPNYKETAFWMKNKEALYFDAIDFVNYEEMNAVFLERCEAHAVPKAEYRD
ncbi:MAG: hypothetical protein IT244_05370 [Bacteroidia bacterium]|nr:hypothetical protein [Bacteroidia bacterium]